MNTGLPRRALGVTGISAPLLGFGVSGPHASPLVSRQATISLIQQALDGGASLFDTAPFYGNGEAETRLGEALRGRRETALVCSKAGTVRAGSRVRKDFSAAYLTASVEGSLQRLRTDRLDILLLHGPGAEHLTDGLGEALAALRQSGKVRLAGVCGRGAEIDRAIGAGWFDIAMFPVNRATQDACRERARAARMAGMGVLGIETMAGTGGGVRAPRRAADLWYLARAARRAARGRELAPKPTTAAPMEDLDWALQSRICDCAVITTTRPDHLAADLALAALAEA